MNQLILIPPGNLPNVINDLYPRIEAATAYSVGKYNGVDVVKMIASGAMQLWVVFDEDSEKVESITITEIASYPQRKILKFLCSTGEDVDNWLHHLGEIERWGEANGCDGSQAETRPGWEKLLKPSGYIKSHVILNKNFGAPN